MALTFLLAVAAVPAATGAPAGAPTSFPDVPADHAFADEIHVVAAAGVLNGYADGLFRPVAGMTRQAAVAALHRLAGSPRPAVGTTGFPDVPTGHPFATAIAWAASIGLMEGYPDGTFRPGAPLSRQAMVAVLYRFNGAPPPRGTFLPRDVAPDHRFAAAIGWAVTGGLATGDADGRFRPTDRVSRQAAAAFLARQLGSGQRTPLGSLQGRLVGLPGSMATPGVSLVAYDLAGSVVGFTSAATDGDYVLRVPVEVPVRVLVWSPTGRWRPQWLGQDPEVPVVLGAGRTDQDLTLEAVAAVEGEVSAGGEPATGMVVTVYDVNGTAVATTTTGGDGTYAFHLARGAYRLGVSDPAATWPTTWSGRAPSLDAAEVLTLVDGSRERADLPMWQWGELSGRVVLDDGGGAADVGIVVLPASGGLRGTRTAVDGTWSVVGLDPGEYTVSVLPTLGGLRYAAVHWPTAQDADDAEPITVVRSARHRADVILHTPATMPLPVPVGRAGDLVVVVGDSIVQQSAHQLHLSVSAVARVSVRGYQGATTEEGLPLLVRYAEWSPDQIVVAFGVNDLVAGDTPTALAGELVAATAQVPTARCAHIVVPTGLTPLLVAGSRIVADALEGAVVPDGRVRLVRWDLTVAGDLAAGSPQGPLISADGIHPTARGEQVLADLVTASVAGCT